MCVSLLFVCVLFDILLGSFFFCHSYVYIHTHIHVYAFSGFIFCISVWHWIHTQVPLKCVLTKL